MALFEACCRKQQQVRPYVLLLYNSRHLQHLLALECTCWCPFHKWKFLYILQDITRLIGCPGNLEHNFAWRTLTEQARACRRSTPVTVGHGPCRACTFCARILQHRSHRDTCSYNGFFKLEHMPKTGLQDVECKMILTRCQTRRRLQHLKASDI